MKGDPGCKFCRGIGHDPIAGVECLEGRDPKLAYMREEIGVAELDESHRNVLRATLKAWWKERVQQDEIIWALRAEVHDLRFKIEQQKENV